MLNVNGGFGRRVKLEALGRSQTLCGIFALISRPQAFISKIKGKLFHCFSDVIILLLKIHFYIPKHLFKADTKFWLKAKIISSLSKRPLKVICY